MNFNLTIDQANLILHALGQLPYQQSFQLIAELQKQAQAQAQQAQVQAQMAMQDAQAKLATSTAAANEGLAHERASRVQENQALAYERMAQANKDDEIALLNKVKWSYVWQCPCSTSPSS